ncbi:MAG: ATP phosphoribosyltransferase regulatory subunit, partial [Nannocystaceae bacterium]
MSQALMTPPELPAAGAFAALPVGLRDLLPSACRRRRAITDALLDVFDRWGYAPVSTPGIEYFDIFGRGLHESERGACVRFIEARTGEVVTLRSDVTPQVARLAATRLGRRLDAGEALRLCYTADVVRVPEGRSERCEHHQVGVELLGDPSPAADAELLALCHAALSAVGLPALRIDLAHVGLAHAVLDAAGVDDDTRALVRRALARKDGGAVAQALRDAEAPARLIAALVELCELYGPPAVLDRGEARL